MTNYRYAPIAHFNGALTQHVSITEKVPWLYTIALIKQKVIYIGETYDEAGIAIRLSTHFGRVINSDLKRCAAEHAGIRKVLPPYLVVAARLPFNDDNAPFNGESKKVRKACESILHEIVTSDFVLPNKWTIVSSSSSSTVITDKMRECCKEIFANFAASFSFFENLSTEVLPFNLIILDRIIEEKEPTPVNVGDIIEDIELQLFDWMIHALKEEYGDDWWTKGVKTPIRTNCAIRQEEEGENDKVPKWAYLTLIDIKAIIEGNWQLFSDVMEVVSNVNGKRKAANWIIYINDTRKLWAHPLKQRFVNIDPGDIAKVQNYQAKLRAAIKNGI